MIIRKGEPRAIRGSADEKFGAYESLRCSDAGRLTQFGAYAEDVEPGSKSSERHWHEKEDGVSSI